MPGRKSNVSTTSNGPEELAESTPSRQTKDKDGLSVDVSLNALEMLDCHLTSVQDLSLPKSMVARLAKGVLPANTQIHKDALLALHKSATVFVSYIASKYVEPSQTVVVCRLCDCPTDRRLLLILPDDCLLPYSSR